MSLSPLVSFKSRFVTYLLNFPRSTCLVLLNVVHVVRVLFVLSVNSLFERRECRTVLSIIVSRGKRN